MFCVEIDNNILLTSPTMGGVAMANLSTAASTGGADSGVAIATLRQAQAGSTGAFAGTVAAGTNQGKRATAISLIPPDGVIPDLTIASEGVKRYGD